MYYSYGSSDVRYFYFNSTAHNFTESPPASDSNWQCRCLKWIAGTIAGRAGKTIRMSATTRASEKAEPAGPQV
jgi:hypothetical protein